jgi:segregation and condensation protein A
MRETPATPFDVPPNLTDDLADGEPRLVVDVGGFEGPLDLLLVLARQQKVDLHHISVLALADQYLAFIEQAKQLRLELAADYLLMAAWLAYLKSRLLLPEPKTGDESSGEDLAEALTEKLRRLQTIRRAGELLVARPALGIDVFTRGTPEGIAVHTTNLYDANLIDLLKAYATRRVKDALARVTIKPRRVWTLNEAREALQRLIGMAHDWTRLDGFLLQYVVEEDMRTSVIASSFASSLELVREGTMELRQEGAFRPLYVRQRVTPSLPSKDRGHG